MNPIQRMRQNRQLRFDSPFSERLAILSLTFPDAANQLRDWLSPTFNHCHDINIKRDICGLPIHGAIQGPMPSFKINGDAFYSQADLSAWMLTWKVGNGESQLRIKCGCIEHFQAVGKAIERVSRSSEFALDWRSTILKAIQDFTEFDYPIEDDALEAA